MTSFCVLVVYLLILFTVHSAFADNCAINFYGSSHVGLSAQTPFPFSNESIDYSQHTISVWAKPSRFVSHEQTILDTGIVGSGADISWAVELKLKLTIWQQGHIKPTTGVLYIDVWILDNAATQNSAIWTKTRYYVILGEGDFPWVQISFTPKSASGTVMVNRKSRRMDKYSPVASSDTQPRTTFLIGEHFYGAIDEVRIWDDHQSQPDIRSSLCLSDITAGAVLYFPFNECSGDVFAGYHKDGVVCAMMYGSYGPTSEAEESSTSSNLVWTTDYIVASRECTPDILEQCSNALRIIDEVDSSVSVDEPSQIEVLVLNITFPDAKFLAIPFAVVLVLVFLLAGRRTQETNEITRC